MPGLLSQLFRGEPRLEKCLTNDGAHVLIGDQGPFVGMIQYAVLALEGGTLFGQELLREQYGPQTAKLVLAYKARRKIINFSYQTKPDNIVGKMTIRSLDTEMLAFETSQKLKVRRS